MRTLSAEILPGKKESAFYYLLRWREGEASAEVQPGGLGQTGWGGWVKKADPRQDPSTAADPSCHPPVLTGSEHSCKGDQRENPLPLLP